MLSLSNRRVLKDVSVSQRPVEIQLRKDFSHQEPEGDRWQDDPLVLAAKRS